MNNNINTYLTNFLNHRPDYSGIKIYDLVTERNEKITNELAKFIDEEINLKNHKLNKNYKNLTKQLQNYYSFTVVYLEDKIIAFSGLQFKNFPQGYGRVLTRTFLSNQNRKTGLTGRKFPDIGSGFMIPYQTHIAKLNNLNNIFFSIENPNKRKYMKLFSEKLSIYTKQSWELLDGYYNVVEKVNGVINNNKSCWQSIILLNNENATFDLPKISESDYSKL